MSKHNRPQPLPSIGPVPKKPFLERCRDEWMAISALLGFVGIIITGYTRIAGFWGTKADAAVVANHDATFDVRLGSAEHRLTNLELNAAVQAAVEKTHYDHLHEEIRGARNDERAANHQPPLPPEPDEDAPRRPR